MRQRLPGGAAIGVGLAILMLLPLSAALAQQTAGPVDPQRANHQQQPHQQRMQQIFNDKAGVVAAIVQRWESEARQSGRWEENYTRDMTAALMKLLPENLATAAEASSLPELMEVLATGSLFQRDEFGQIVPASLGDVTGDLVFTPVTPCRIVDTRYAGGAISGGTRYFDADNTTSFASQGGNSAPCGVPYGVARAIAATITVTYTTGSGWITAWGGGGMPLASVLNYATNDTVANSTVIPIVPGAGNDFSIYSSATAHVIIDVIGYYAAPVATALACTTVNAVGASVGQNLFTTATATCEAGYTLTGGGHYATNANVYVPVSYPNASNGWTAYGYNTLTSTQYITAYARCCRVPGR